MLDRHYDAVCDISLVSRNMYVSVMLPFHTSSFVYLHTHWTGPFMFIRLLLQSNLSELVSLVIVSIIISSLATTSVRP